MPQPAAANARILFVEDEESISEPFAEALRGAGFEPTVTRTAAGALELAERLEPDLVLLDLALPDGDGRDVCRELRRHSNVPILMLTARGTEMDRIAGWSWEPTTTWSSRSVPARSSRESGPCSGEPSAASPNSR